MEAAAEVVEGEVMEGETKETANDSLERTKNTTRRNVPEAILRLHILVITL